ncbi:kinesin-like protein KIF9 [Venturia canescens]|uniref:kinesin-like protein KIF9 n=1 Tax=Venturia canescens TaxID=32260 RepID=UPI001C9CF2D1|nr:kinesin-like protein KIF9 [Venturia canescens]
MQSNKEAPEASQSIKVYVRILPLLERCENCAKINKKSHSSVLDGANFVLVCCGQTGTGKSFTTGGLRNNWEHRGIVPRLLGDLMLEKERRKRTNKIQCSLSYVEFCGKQFKDLLNPNFTSSRSNNSRDVFKNISQVTITNEKVALQHVFQGEGRRAQAERSEYPVCNLGTSVITLHIRNTSLITSWAVDSSATIHIVEMAGIDNTRNPNCPKATRDVISANSMKSELEQFFVNSGRVENTLSSNARSNYFLKYLGDALKFDSIIRFIAHIKVKMDDLDVSLSTLRFVGNIAKVSISQVAFDARPQSTMFIEKLQDDIKRLKRELYINEMFFHQEASMNVSTQRAQQIQNDFLGFLNGSISDLELISLSQAQVLTKMMKDYYSKVTAEKEKAQKDLVDCENALKNGTGMISKTSSHDSAKGASRKFSNSKDLRLVVNSEEDNGNSKVGSLEANGITLGPGVSEIPTTSKLTFPNLAIENKPKDYVPVGKKSYNKNGGSFMNKNFQNEGSERHVRETFERLQAILKRLTAINYEASSSRKKGFRESIVVPRTNKQQKNRK